jgi:hypothetical protein
VAVAVEPDLGPLAFAVAIPMAWAGAMGPVVVTVLDAPTAPSATTLLGTERNSEVSLVPPEFAGFSTALRTLLPVAVSAVATAPVFVARFVGDAAERGTVGHRSRAVHRAGRALGAPARRLGHEDPRILRRRASCRIMNTSRSNRPPSRSGRPPSQRTRNRDESTSSSRGRARSRATRRARLGHGFGWR